MDNDQLQKVFSLAIERSRTAKKAVSAWLRMPVGKGTLSWRTLLLRLSVAGVITAFIIYLYILWASSHGL